MIVAQEIVQALEDYDDNTTCLWSVLCLQPILILMSKDCYYSSDRPNASTRFGIRGMTATFYRDQAQMREDAQL